MKIGSVKLDSSKSYNVESYQLAQYTNDVKMYYIIKEGLISDKVKAMGELRPEEIMSPTALQTDRYSLNLCKTLLDWELRNPPFESVVEMGLPVEAMAPDVEPNMTPLEVQELNAMKDTDYNTMGTT